jgi:predicted dithiol-disulfide oxidoreductase (DUF899 family)
MTDRKTGTREEWLAARLELLEAEKELTRRSDELARRRQELPWVRIDKEYRFETDEGQTALAATLLRTEETGMLLCAAHPFLAKAAQELGTQIDGLFALKDALGLLASTKIR